MDFSGYPQRNRKINQPRILELAPIHGLPGSCYVPAWVAGGNSLRVRSTNESWGCRLNKV